MRAHNPCGNIPWQLQSLTKATNKLERTREQFANDAQWAHARALDWGAELHSVVLDWERAQIVLGRECAKAVRKHLECLESGWVVWGEQLDHFAHALSFHGGDHAAVPDEVRTCAETLLAWVQSQPAPELAVTQQFFSATGASAPAVLRADACVFGSPTTLRVRVVGSVRIVVEFPGWLDRKIPWKYVMVRISGVSRRGLREAVDLGVLNMAEVVTAKGHGRREQCVIKPGCEDMSPDELAARPAIAATEYLSRLFKAVPVGEEFEVILAEVYLCGMLIGGQEIALDERSWLPMAYRCSMFCPEPGQRDPALVPQPEPAQMSRVTSPPATCGPFVVETDFVFKTSTAHAKVRESSTGNVVGEAQFKLPKRCRCAKVVASAGMPWWVGDIFVMPSDSRTRLPIVHRIVSDPKYAIIGCCPGPFGGLLALHRGNKKTTLVYHGPVPGSLPECGVVVKRLVLGPMAPSAAIAVRLEGRDIMLETTSLNKFIYCFDIGEGTFDCENWSKVAA